MPAPTSYTEAGLRDYVVAALGTVGAALGWTSATAQVTEAVYDALYAYGPTDTTVEPPTYAIALMTDIRKLRAFARREGWKQAKAATAAGYDFAADGQSLKRSQLYAQASREYDAAWEEAAGYDGIAMIQPATVKAAGTPYAALNVTGELG